MAQAAGQSWAGRGGSAPGGGTEDFPSLLPGSSSSSSYQPPPPPPSRPSQPRPSQPRPATAPTRPAEDFPRLPVRARRPAAAATAVSSSSSRPNKPAAVARPATAVAKPVAAKPSKPAPKRIDPFDSDSGDDYPSLEVKNMREYRYSIFSLFFSVANPDSELSPGSRAVTICFRLQGPSRSLSNFSQKTVKLSGQSMDYTRSDPTTVSSSVSLIDSSMLAAMQGRRHPCVLK